MGNEMERSDLDRLLFENCSKPINEIAEITGLTPEDAATRLADMFKKRGVLHDLYREQILLEQLWELKDKVLAQVDEVGPRNIAGVVNATRSLVELSLKRLDAQRERNRGDIDRIDNMHAEVLGRALGVAMSTFVERSGMDQEESYIIMEQVLPEAFAILEEKTEK